MWSEGERKEIQAIYDKLAAIREDHTMIHTLIAVQALQAKRLDAIEKTLEEITSALNMARGGLKVLIAVATVAAGMGAFANHFVTFLKDLSH